LQLILTKVHEACVREQGRWRDAFYNQALAACQRSRPESEEVDACWCKRLGQRCAGRSLCLPSWPTIIEIIERRTLHNCLIHLDTVKIGEASWYCIPMLACDCQPHVDAVTPETSEAVEDAEGFLQDASCFVRAEEGRVLTD